MRTELCTRDEVMSHLRQTTSEQLQQLQVKLEGKVTELASLNSHLTELKDAADVSNTKCTRPNKVSSGFKGSFLFMCRRSIVRLRGSWLRRKKSASTYSRTHQNGQDNLRSV